MKQVIVLRDQLAELKRERGMRLHVYPRLLASDKLTDAQAVLQLDRLSAAIETLEELVRQREPELPL
jgi:hypothetical protein